MFTRQMLLGTYGSYESTGNLVKMQIQLHRSAVRPVNLHSNTELMLVLLVHRPHFGFFCLFVSVFTFYFILEYS